MRSKKSGSVRSTRVFQKLCFSTQSYCRHLWQKGLELSIYIFVSWTINSLSRSLPLEIFFSISPSSLMLVNLTIASADVCRVNKSGNNVCTVNRNPALFRKQLFCTFQWSLHSLGVVQCWCSFLFRLSLGYVSAHRKLFVTFNMRIMFTWIKTWWYRFALLFIPVFSTKLASSFFILI